MIKNINTGKINGATPIIIHNIRAQIGIAISVKINDIKIVLIKLK